MEKFNFQYEDDKELKIKQYIINYLQELQRHFDMSDGKMRSILYKVYKSKSPISKFSIFIKKHISMIKSFYINKLKGI